MANGNKLIDQKAIDTIIDSILKAVEIKLNKKSSEGRGKDGKDGKDGRDGKDAASPRILTFSILPLDWVGDGLFTYIISEDRITDRTAIVECVLTAETRGNQLSDINWETSFGKATLNTTLKPAGELSGYMILTEVE